MSVRTRQVNVCESVWSTVKKVYANGRCVVITEITLVQIGALPSREAGFRSQTDWSRQLPLHL